MFCRMHRARWVVGGRSTKGRRAGSVRGWRALGAILPRRDNSYRPARRLWLARQEPTRAWTPAAPQSARLDGEPTKKPAGAMDACSAIGCSPGGRANEKARRGHGCRQRYRLLAWRASPRKSPPGPWMPAALSTARLEGEPTKKPAGAMDGPAGVKWRRGESNPCPVMFQHGRLRVCPVNLSLVRASPADRVRHGPARNVFSPGRTRR